MIMFLTHHKCGSRALSHYVMSLCKKNNLSLYCSHIGKDKPAGNYDFIYLSNAQYDYVKYDVYGQVLHFIRNPLSIVHSAYYSHLNTHALDGWPELENQRLILTTLSKEEGMLKTAQFCNAEEFYKNTAGPLYALKRWDYGDDRINTVCIEDCFDRLTSSIKANLEIDTRHIIWPDDAPYKFEKLSGGRKAGLVDESSHYRAGDLNAWKKDLPVSTVNYVVRECREVLDLYYRDSVDWIAKNYGLHS